MGFIDHCIVLYSLIAVLYCIVLNCIALYCVVLYCIVLQCVVFCSALHSFVLQSFCCIVFRCIVLYCIKHTRMRTAYMYTCVRAYIHPEFVQNKLDFLRKDTGRLPEGPRKATTPFPSSERAALWVAAGGGGGNVPACILQNINLQKAWVPEATGRLPEGGPEET